MLRNFAFLAPFRTILLNEFETMIYTFVADQKKYSQVFNVEFFIIFLYN